ncbi:PREDICTED: spore wall protein 2 [Cyphomyrmex costatus]|uniref:spore wall protein 2 n=1 Tax=Cyphomyrmex costatus TaxID=456900 RepID=UPI000852452C|nr:PREDICTED: spore wall protein 2 [Cyphomyrmex costatus]
MASLKYVVVFSLLMVMLAYHYAGSASVPVNRVSVHRFVAPKGRGALNIEESEQKEKYDGQNGQNEEGNTEEGSEDETAPVTADNRIRESPILKDIFPSWIFHHPGHSNSENSESDEDAELDNPGQGDDANEGENEEGENEEGENEEGENEEGENEEGENEPDEDEGNEEK